NFVYSFLHETLVQNKTISLFGLRDTKYFSSNTLMDLTNGRKRVRLPAPAQLIRSDLECKTRTNLPINHCAEMLT
ncbi:hypothetical protein ACYKPH_09025, partial [Streptococcus suis]